MRIDEYLECLKKFKYKKIVAFMKKLFNANLEKRLSKGFMLLFLICGFSANGTITYAAFDTTPSGIPMADLEETVDNYMEDYIGKRVIGAAIIFIKDGEIAFSKGYGYADRENGIKVNPETSVFEYASISKTFTWTAVMQQVEVGKIDLNEDITVYFPEDFARKYKKNLSYDKPVTMLDLMNHKAGFEENYFYEDELTEDSLIDTLEEALLKQMPRQVYEPGTVTAYSNFSTGIAGYVVECVTGEKLYDYLKTNVFDVLDMKVATADPRYNDMDFIVQNKAKGYRNYDDSGVDGWTYCNIYPDGSVNGTAFELAKFAMAYMKEDCPLFKKQQTVKEMFSPSYRASESISGCAHGFWEYEGKSLYYQHDGGHTGFSTIFSFSQEEKSGLVVLANTGEEIYVTYGLTQLLLGDDGDINISAKKNLPNAYELDGMEFLSARRNYSDITALFSYLEGNEEVKALDENTITVNGLTYIQTKPYLYELTDDKDSLIARMVYPKIYFYHNNGEITGFTFGGVIGSDYIGTKPPYTNIWLIFQAGVLVIASIVFLATILSVCVIIIKNKKRRAELPEQVKLNNTFFLGISMCGFLTILNHGILGIYLLGNDAFSTLRVNIHIAVNWALLFMCIIAITIRIAKAITDKQKFHFNKRAAIMVLLLLSSCSINLIWNSFAFI